MKSVLGKVFIVVWVIVVTIVMSFQMAEHILSKPIPTEIEKISNSLFPLNEANEKPWLIVHVIYDNCTCTNRLISGLVDRDPMPIAREHIIFVGTARDDLKAAKKRGYIIDYINEAELESRYFLESAPILIVMDAQNKIRYLGGYYKRSAAIKPYDSDIFWSTVAGELVEPLPIYGCAVSQRLQEVFDPLGLKY